MTTMTLTLTDELLVCVDNYLTRTLLSVHIEENGQETTWELTQHGTWVELDAMAEISAAEAVALLDAIAEMQDASRIDQDDITHHVTRWAPTVPLTIGQGWQAWIGDQAAATVAELKSGRISDLAASLIDSLSHDERSGGCSIHIADAVLWLMTHRAELTEALNKHV